ncbi:hypothetical protein [Streptomyces sp. NRRL S-340]|uniref:hypothetical protein n=1 Tax=Streptomyces sp. NRRL S-340 TaxID=1463901 RepID=UPI000565B479|nr:hypothetical protein [Streptomyces sp. NRRL S-340]
MTNHEVHAAPAPADLDGDLASLRGDCARMAPRWSAPDRKSGPEGPGTVSAARIHGVSVPDSSARLLESMSDYGD